MFPRREGSNSTAAHPLLPPSESQKPAKPAAMYANEDKMHLLLWMTLGSAIGWGLGRTLQDGGYDWFRDVVMGIGGAVVGGLLGISDGLGGYRGTITTVMMAVVAATLLTLLVRRANPSKFRLAWPVRQKVRLSAPSTNSLRPKEI